MTNSKEIKIHPQLARNYSPTIPIQWPFYIEPKLDGLRGLVVVDSTKTGMSWSRSGKPLWNTEHVIQELAQRPWKDYVLDGEFFTADWNLSMSITKTQSPHPEALKIKYHVWDVIPIQAWMNGRYNTPLRQRKAVLDKGFRDLQHTSVVEHYLVHNMEEAQERYRLLLEAGYEGGMLKDPESQYVLGARSNGWLKMKPWNDVDLTIVGAVRGKGKHQERLGCLVLRGSAEINRVQVEINTEVGTGFTDAEREYLWSLYHSGQLIGQVAEIRYQEITRDGSCRFPVFHRLREDK